MKTSTRDNLIYVGVGLLAVAVLGGWISYHARSGQDIPDFPAGPVWVVLTAAILFGDTLYQYRRFLRQSRFWTVFLLLLAAHLIGWSALVRLLERLPLLLMALACAPEGGLIYLAMEKFVRRGRRRARSLSS